MNVLRRTIAKSVIAVMIAIVLVIFLRLFSSMAERSPIVTAAAETVTYDFETGTVEGWEPSTKQGEQGIAAVSVTTTAAYQGSHSLAVRTQLDGSVADRRQGMTYIMYPGNLAQQTVSVYINCPLAAIGDTNHPNGVQLFAKDQSFHIQVSPWQNLGQQVPLGQWHNIQWTPTSSNPPGGYTDAGFDPTKVMFVGVKLGLGTGSQVPFYGTCHLDVIRLDRASLTVPPSDHIFDFELAPEHQVSKPFGYGPYWDADPGWGADAWHSEDVRVRDGALAITAAFSLQNPYDSQKGYVGIEHLPSLDINNKDSRAIRAQVRFDPYVGPERMLASIWVYDRRDAGPGFKWYASISTTVGGAVWNELVFDLDNPAHYLVDPAQCPNCILPTEVTTTSLRNILKIGIQFFANDPYSGTVFVDNVTVGGKELPVPNLNAGFVKTDGPRFELSGQTYRFAGNNVYYMFYKSHYMIDDVFETMQRNGIKVLRTWGFSDGKAPFAADGDGTANGNEGSAFQPEAELYYQPTWVNMDYVIQTAGRYGIRLIVPLVNHWSDRDVAGGQNSFGGMGQYLDWCGTATYDGIDGRITNKATFYTDDCARALYKKYLSYVLNRVNTLTGVAYKDDPTILAWELANEPRCQPSDGCPSQDALYDWTDEMSGYVKSQDTNHLVALGDEGFLAQPGDPDPYRNGFFGVDWERNLGIQTIDFGTVHLYPDHWDKDLSWADAWIKDHIRLARKVGKPVVFEEYGVCLDRGEPYFTGSCDNQFDRDQTYARWTRLFETGAAGDAVWMIAGQVNGANEAHKQIGSGYYYPDYDGFTFWEPSSTMGVIRAHASRMTPDSLIYLPVVLKRQEGPLTAPEPSQRPTSTSTSTATSK